MAPIGDGHEHPNRPRRVNPVADTAPSDIAVFTLARITEEEADALAAPEGPWEWEAVGASGYPQRVTNAAAVLVAECFENPDLPAACAAHIARNDPPAVLARCAALRAIFDEHELYYEHGKTWCSGCGDDINGLPRHQYDECPTRRGIAAIWRGHEDWRKEWEL